MVGTNFLKFARKHAKISLMGRYQPSGYLVDPPTGVFANRAGGDRLKPTESGEFANTFRSPIGAALSAAAAIITDSNYGHNDDRHGGGVVSQRHSGYPRLLAEDYPTPA
jgi:hypothetical protein